MATTYDNASLVMIPSGVKEDKLYSIKPTDGSGDFTFSRGSDIEATRVNSSGLIEKAKENLLLQSNSFDTTWLNAATTETGGQSGYDGTNDAWLLERSSAAAYLYQTIATTSVVTLSIYAKAGTLDWFLLACNGGTGSAYFNLTGAGSIGTANGIDANIESVGGGWYRCSVTSTGSMNAVRIFPAQGNGDVGGTSGNIYIQDAQLNHGLIAQDYVETTTTAVVEGLTADLPRLDYSGGASCPSLLLEPSRTNVLTQSEYFGSTPYTATNSSITSNDITSPEGVVNGAKLESTSNGSASRLDSFPTLSDNTIYTASAFFKKGNVNYCFIGIRGKDGVATSVYFDLENGTKGTENNSPIDADIEQYGDWYRCYVVQNVNSGGTAPRIQLAVANADNDFSTANGEYNYIYGAQLEAGSYPTSYIPTYGTAAVRGADDCVKTGISSLVGASEYTIFWEGSHIPTGEFNSFATIYNSSALGESARFYRNNTDNQIYAAAFISGNSVSLASGITTESAKCAFRVKSGDFALYVNGSLVASSTSSMTPSASLNSVNLQYFNSGQSFDQNTKQMLFFQTALTNAELAALTTI